MISTVPLKWKKMFQNYWLLFSNLLFSVLNLPPDVAGATLMAAGSSGPELATAVIGVFVAKVLACLRTFVN